MKRVKKKSGKCEKVKKSEEKKRLKKSEKKSEKGNKVREKKLK